MSWQLASFCSAMALRSQGYNIRGEIISFFPRTMNRFSGKYSRVSQKQEYI